MHIIRIAIRGLKSIREQSIDLHPINILIGSNGVGKSNFVSSLELLQKIFQQHLQGYILRNGGANSMLYMGSKYTSIIDMRLEIEDNERDYEYTLQLVPAQDRLIIGNFTYEYKHGSEMVFSYKCTDVPELDYEGKMALSGFLGPLFSAFEVYHFHDTGATSLMKQQQAINDNRKLKFDGSNIASYLYMLQQAYPQSYKLIEATVRSVSPFFKAFSLSPNPSNANYISLEWIPKDGDDDTVFTPYQLSDGTLRFICLTTLLLQPALPQVIILDEPELGLHPAAIIKLAALIRKASFSSQIIVSTQSVNLLDQFSLNDVLLVERRDNQTTFLRPDFESAKGWLEDYSLGQIWQKNVIGG